MPQDNNDFSQIPITLPLKASFAREDLIESTANSLAIELIDNWPNWPSNVVILAGPVGSGKSHLAKVWANQANAIFSNFEEIAKHKDTLNMSQNLVLEDVTAENIDEELLFHSYNQLKANGAYLLITSREFPSAWQLKLPDLKSRLGTAHVVELQEPDDALLSQILVKLFADRQLQVPSNMIDYLVTRMERSLGAAGEIVEWLDNEALSTRSKITRALAAKALAHFETLEKS